MHAAQKASNTLPTPNTGQQTATTAAPSTQGQVTPTAESNEASTSQPGASGDPDVVPLADRVEK